MTRIAYFDCFAGVSGDMILAALIDAGLPAKDLIGELYNLNLTSFKFQSRSLIKNGFKATKVDIIVEGDTPERRVGEITELVESCKLIPVIKQKALSMILRLGDVEAGIHGIPVQDVRLHELGGIDTIVDIIGTLIGLHILKIEQVYASPLPLGRGIINGAHGTIPLPAPATLALLRNIPIIGNEFNVELVTPTGALLLSSLVDSFGSIPAMTLLCVGYGAGSRDLPIPNLLRLLIGEKSSNSFTTCESLVMLESNIDDLNPQLFDHVMTLLLSAGALDVTLTPIQMKKNRPAIQIAVLCQPSEVDKMETILFSETSTLGIRFSSIERHALSRSFITVTTLYGPVKMKVVKLQDGRDRATPEYEDCRKLAELHQVPLQEVIRQANHSYHLLDKDKEDDKL